MRSFGHQITASSAAFI